MQGSALFFTNLKLPVGLLHCIMIDTVVHKADLKDVVKDKSQTYTVASSLKMEQKMVSDIICPIVTIISQDYQMQWNTML